MTTARLRRVTIRSYQVGFGDCFLLRFDYGSLAPRFVLIDFGSTGLRGGATPAQRLVKIAGDIRDTCSTCHGKLDVVIATHRHKDHIAGFETNDGQDAPGDIIRECASGAVVVLPWTEDPEAAPDAVRPTSSSDKSALIRSLASMQAFAAELPDYVSRIEHLIPQTMARQLSFLGETNLANRAAVRNLLTMGRRRVYAYAGSPLGLGRILPGVTISVLGPPTLEQSSAIRRQRARDADEFWHLQAAALAPQAKSQPALFPNARSTRRGTLPLEMRWLVPRLRKAHARGLLELVRSLDDALNNTSLILLFEFGHQKLLFPGDAQIENWSYALFDNPRHQQIRQTLAQTTVYKVGHHGSLNATPRTLWNGFAHRGGEEATCRLETLLSTMAGKHGSKDGGTEVPREPLVQALRAQSALHSTQDIKVKDDGLYLEVSVEP